MSFTPYGATSALALQATTGIAGVALINGTQNIVSWTTPNDGAIHRVLINLTLVVTSGETGGQITYAWTSPDGTARSTQVIAASQSTGFFGNGTSQWIAFPVAANSLVAVKQATALTVGASTAWAEILGS